MDNLLNTILQMLEGSEITLEIFFVTLVIALPLGMMAALGRLSKWRPLSAFMEFYIWLMRGTPLMLQLLFVYFALPMIGIRLPDIAAALLAFTLNYAAYFAEIFRAGILAVDAGQTEAARSLGLSATQAMKLVVLPQAVKNVLPALGNEVVTMVKESSICSTLGMVELMFAAKTVATSTYISLAPYVLAALMYFCITYPAGKAIEALERRMRRGDKH